MTIEPYAYSNLSVLLILGGVLLAAGFVRRNRLWGEAAASLWRRRRLALCVLAVYSGVALLEIYDLHE